MNFTEIGPTLAIAIVSRDSRRRTLAKTMVYRVVAIALLAGITYYYTGSAGEATAITILFNVTGAVSYYGLERLWEEVQWGRRRTETPVNQGDRVSLNLPPAGSRAVTSKRPVEID
jgi:uncharacterized membrane protein